MLIGACAVKTTGDEQTWSDFTCDITPTQGFHDLYLHFGSTLNLDYFQIQ